MPDIGPHPGMQTAICTSKAELILFGARAGVGKSWGGLMLILMWVAHKLPGDIIVFRRRAQDLYREGGIVSSARKIFGKDPRCQIRAGPMNDFRWAFPDGQLSVTFAAIPDVGDERTFEGPGYNLVIFDEGTHFEWRQIAYMLTRTREPEDGPAADRMPPSKVAVNLNPIAYGALRELAGPFLDETVVWKDHLAEQHVGGIADPDLSGQLRWVARAPEGHEGHFLIGATEEEVKAQLPEAKLDPLKYTLISGDERDNPSLNWKDYNKKLAFADPWEVRVLRFSDWNASPAEPGKIWQPPAACFFRSKDACFDALVDSNVSVRWYGAWDYGRKAHGLCYVGGVLQPGAPPTLWVLACLVWTQTPALTAAADRAAAVGQTIRDAGLEGRILSQEDFGDPSGEAADSGEGWAATLRQHDVPLVPIASMEDAEHKTWWSQNSHEGFQRRTELVQWWMNSSQLRVASSLEPLVASLQGWSYDLGKGRQTELIEVERRVLRPTKGRLSHPGDAITYLCAGVAVVLGQEGEVQATPDIEMLDFRQAARLAKLNARPTTSRAEYFGLS